MGEKKFTHTFIIQNNITEENAKNIRAAAASRPRPDFPNVISLKGIHEAFFGFVFGIYNLILVCPGHFLIFCMISMI